LALSGSQPVPAGVNERWVVMITGSIATLGAGMVAMGAAVGIGWIGSSAVSAMSRQPEMAPKIQITMLIACALVEGIALFCAVICMLYAK